jgi:hypothetical protein
MSPDFGLAVGFHFGFIIFSLLVALLFCPENGEYTFLRDISGLLPSYTAFHPTLTSNSPNLFP